MSELKAVTEKELVRLSVDAIVGNIDLALDKLNFLSTSLHDNYILQEWDDDIATFDIKQREMFLICTMIADYLEDVKEAKEMLEEEFYL